MNVETTTPKQTPEPHLNALPTKDDLKRDHHVGLVMNEAYDMIDTDTANSDKVESRKDVINSVGNVAAWHYDIDRESPFLDPERPQALKDNLEPLINILTAESDDRRKNAQREREIDPKTGLANEVAFVKAKPAAEADPNIFFTAFDGDNFGKVNKKGGYSLGDEAIVMMAEKIKFIAKTFNCERIFRLGGDEFVILSNGEMTLEETKQMRDYAVDYFSKKKFGPTTVSLSGGVGGTFKKSDEDMQKNKKSKRGFSGKVTKIKDFMRPGIAGKKSKAA